MLNRPLYSFAEAARLLDLSASKLRSWVDGTVRKGVEYPPVIRPRRTGNDYVTWAEFVEAGFLREYRTRLSLQRLRPLIEAMRQDFGVPYPLAHFRPFVDPKAKQLLVPLQERLGVDEELQLVVRAGPGSWQLTWAAPVMRFLEKVDLDEDGVVIRLFPVGSPVTIDPEVAFGVPQVHGIRTETIAEAYATGETVEAIASSWDLATSDVEAALRWELRRAA